MSNLASRRIYLPSNGIVPVFFLLGLAVGAVVYFWPQSGYSDIFLNSWVYFLGKYLLLFSSAAFTLPFLLGALSGSGLYLEAANLQRLMKTFPGREHGG